MNPYQAPKAKVEAAQQVGEVMRSGKLVRIDRDGALPDRCVLCNADARGYRVARKLYWSPKAWRIGAMTTPFVVLGIAITGQSPVMLAIFWPLVLILVVANAFVRQSLTVELPVCEQHRKLRNALRWLSLACLAGLVAPFGLYQMWDHALTLLWISVGGLVILATLQSLTGIQSIGIEKVSGAHVWLSRTGEPFRSGLTEAPS